MRILFFVPTPPTALPNDDRNLKFGMIGPCVTRLGAIEAIFDFLIFDF